MGKTRPAAKRDLALRNDILPCHRELFYTNLEEDSEKETTATGLLQWVSTWGQVIRHSFQEAKKRIVKGMRSLCTKYVHVTPAMLLVQMRHTEI